VKRLPPLALLGLWAWVLLGWIPETTSAQQAVAPRVIGVISPGFGVDSDEAQTFREGLRAAGYVDGRDVSIDWWYGQGSYNGVADAVAKVVQSKVDVIVVESVFAALATKRATQTIPIVMALVGDPVRVGLVENLSHPGGNITGLTNMTAELGPKRLQLLKEAIPSVRRVGVLWNPDTPLHRVGLANLNAAAPQLGLELVPVAAQKVEQFGPAFSTLSRSRVNAVLILDDAFMASHGSILVEPATKGRLPLVSGYKPLCKQGMLICYQTKTTDLFRRAAGYVDKILKGVSPATLPVEQPTKFELVVNVKAARALGVTVPESILLQADEVIR